MVNSHPLVPAELPGNSMRLSFFEEKAVVELIPPSKRDGIYIIVLNYNLIKIGSQ